jgi:hypothetical protein
MVKDDDGLGQNSQHSSKHEENSSIQYVLLENLSGLLCRYLDFSKTPKFGVCWTGQCKAKMTFTSC